MTGTQYAKVNQANRRAWASEMPAPCMACRTTLGTDIHEIERRGQAPLRWAHRCNYLLVCRLCHAGDLVNMPHAKQLAIKLLEDRENFDLEAWNAIRNRQVTLPEVMQWYQVLVKDRS